ncbi:MAG: hypothetical protein IJH86_04190 [Clostridia bacterium]|nr:hypothetical protein [Clostridia bacterium]
MYDELTEVDIRKTQEEIDCREAGEGVGRRAILRSDPRHPKGRRRRQPADPFILNQNDTGGQSYAI